MAEILSHLNSKLSSSYILMKEHTKYMKISTIPKFPAIRCIPLVSRNADQQIKNFQTLHELIHDTLYFCH